VFLFAELYVFLLIVFCASPKSDLSCSKVEIFSIDFFRKVKADLKKNFFVKPKIKIDICFG